MLMNELTSSYCQTYSQEHEVQIEWVHTVLVRMLSKKAKIALRMSGMPPIHCEFGVSP